jgi:hypothetical protein
MKRLLILDAVLLVSVIAMFSVLTSSGPAEENRSVVEQPEVKAVEDAVKSGPARSLNDILGGRAGNLNDAARGLKPISKTEQRAENIIRLVNAGDTSPSLVDHVLDDFAVLAKLPKSASREQKAANYLAQLWKFHYDNQKRLAVAEAMSRFDQGYELKIDTSMPFVQPRDE